MRACAKEICDEITLGERIGYRKDVSSLVSVRVKEGPRVRVERLD